ncbi:DUF551 domain-containing protein [Salmonella enterica subsp. enterica serovar Indiana]|nr:DUF551 domain-containing protein [Salmonella enterica subsp. enterica serovar Indiana]MCQ3308523.1 DUF551 domain-containing protein [Salmonella enterica subsp. enterica serovar Indiana]MCQ3349814.1 DUF551 domain-containing protein [Salmonella enterica subsp. enterica serovar Indiana]
MSAITKERIELFIKNPLDNGLTRGEQMELARIALASLEAEPVAVNDDMAYAFHHALSDSSLGADEVEEIKAGLRAAFANVTIQPEPVVPDEIEPDDSNTFDYVDGWNACRAAMLQSGNFRENKNSSTNNFREIAETSTNYPVIPSEVLSAILKVAKIRADFDDFDGDRRGIGDCLDEAEQELIVTINKYASQLAAEPIAPNDVREQTAIPQVPVTPDGWISCSERMPDTKTAVLVAKEFDRKGDWRMKWATYIPGHPDANDGWIIPGASWKPSHWMPLPEPPQEVNRG